MPSQEGKDLLAAHDAKNAEYDAALKRAGLIIHKRVDDLDMFEFTAAGYGWDIAWDHRGVSSVAFLRLAERAEDFLLRVTFINTRIESVVNVIDPSEQKKLQGQNAFSLTSTHTDTLIETLFWLIVYGTEANERPAPPQRVALTMEDLTPEAQKFVKSVTIQRLDTPAE